jgi:hypothetical protein
MECFMMSEEVIVGINAMKMTALPEDVSSYFSLTVMVADQDSPDERPVKKGDLVFFIEAGPRMRPFLKSKEASAVTN